GQTKYWHWRFAKPAPAHVSSFLSSSTEQHRSNRRRRKHGPNSACSMRAADARKVTHVFPTDRSGKRSKILYRELKDLHRTVRGARNSTPSLAPRAPPSRLQKRNILLC